MTTWKQDQAHAPRARGVFVYALAIALGGLIGIVLSGGCALLPIRDIDDVRHLVSAADVLVSNVAPLCEAASPVPREHPCLALPSVTTGLDRVREALERGDFEAARDAWQRVAPAVEALAGALR
jgi:hypothetical protein